VVVAADPQPTGHDRRNRPRTSSITTVAQTLLDFAAVAPQDNLRKALAEADYRRLINHEQLDGIERRGHRGTTKLRRARNNHLPQLARTKSPFEDDFLVFCEAHAIPIPEVNVIVEGHKVDALWRDRRVIVELDGHGAHATPARIERDRHRDLTHRRAGYTVLRYTRRQIKNQPEELAADIKAALSPPAPSVAQGSR
jgi:hypothetical protein